MILYFYCLIVLQLNFKAIVLLNGVADLARCLDYPLPVLSCECSQRRRTLCDGCQQDVERAPQNDKKNVFCGLRRVCTPEGLVKMQYEKDSLLAIPYWRIVDECWCCSLALTSLHRPPIKSGYVSKKARGGSLYYYEPKATVISTESDGTTIFHRIWWKLPSVGAIYVIFGRGRY